jgi:hypothetical protein
MSSSPRILFGAAAIAETVYGADAMKHRTAFYNENLKLELGLFKLGNTICADADLLNKIMAKKKALATKLAAEPADV